MADIRLFQDIENFVGAKRLTRENLVRRLSRLPEEDKQQYMLNLATHVCGFLYAENAKPIALMRKRMGGIRDQFEMGLDAGIDHRIVLNVEEVKKEYGSALRHAEVARFVERYNIYVAPVFKRYYKEWIENRKDLVSEHLIPDVSNIVGEFLFSKRRRGSRKSRKSKRSRKSRKGSRKSRRSRSRKSRSVRKSSRRRRVRRSRR